MFVRKKETETEGLTLTRGDSAQTHGAVETTDSGEFSVVACWPFGVLESH